ncbi:M23 family metallopeptidase [Streptomyces antnestii]|uniref:M23 family metallopeptidase n=1 Tax=Streptomyces antnestii TaxID=2494256 RepID=A0A437P7R3_9ACTN|nr:M23 family metallopeptidase [Streptomyces sp. San01]RVU18326.1 M23 family metallopeptidase [Streptomyces sp. San01]
MNDRHPSGNQTTPAPAQDADYAPYASYDPQSAQHSGYTGYDGHATGAFVTDPLFGDYSGAHGTGSYADAQWSTGAQQTLTAQEPPHHDPYAAQQHTSSYDTGGYDTTAVWGTAAHQQLADIPAQSGPDASGQWDTSAWADQSGQWDASTFGAPSQGFTPHEAFATQDGFATQDAFGAQDAFGTQTFQAPSAFDNGATGTTGTFDAQGYETQGFEAHGYENQTYETQAFDAQAFDARAFEAQPFATQAFEAPAFADPAAADAPNSFDSFESPDARHDYGQPDAPEPELSHTEDIGNADDADDVDDAQDVEEIVARDERPAPVAPAQRSRSRRRTPAKRSALFTVAVPSVCVIGVAGVAAASVGGLGGDDSKDTTAASAPDATAVKPSVANNKLDTQLANLSADAGDFADRASRTQERIDLRAKQEEQRKQAAEEAARKERLRPKFVLPVTQRGLSAYFGQAGINWMSIHTGIDFPVSYGTPVMAATDGTIRSQWNNAYGNMTILTAKDGTETWYCHLSSRTVTSGPVKAGDVIAHSGNSGNSTGPHLHFEVRPGGGSAVDPLPWLRSHGLDPT